MVNKIFGVKNITHLLYGIIVLLPMMAILGRVCYTVANKNANQSYSNQFVSSLNKITNKSDLIDGQEYTWMFENKDTNVWSTAKIGFYDISIDLTPYLPNTRNYTAISFQPTYIIGYYDNNGTIALDYGTNYPNNHVMEMVGKFTFTARVDQTDNITTNQQCIYIQTIYTTEKLDNAFEYSLKTFTEDNNLGEVDMFSWFTDLFLDHSNAHNQIYIGFVNWYLNYTMLVSCGYLFFLVLIWFINFIRRILDKSMYQDYGGF